MRLSGSLAVVAAQAVTRENIGSLEPRRAVFAHFGTSADAVLDEGLVIHFPAPHSYTGEEVVELQVHGSPRLLRLLLERLIAVPGVRLAEPGEFTRRAFLNGRMDLTRAEAVADLIAADSEAAVRAASAQLSGALQQQLVALRAPLVALHADLEANLDFPEEAEDVELDVIPRLEAAQASVRGLLDAGVRGALVRRGARVVLYGPVNAGKSTLFNRLIGESRALVDEEPGTTRDVLEARLEWAGVSVTLVDTAGLREQPGRLEAMGIERTRAAVTGADIAVLLLPSAGRLPADEDGWNAGEPGRDAWRAMARSEALVVVQGRADDGTRTDPEAAAAVSGLTGAGVDGLRRLLEGRLQRDVASASAVTSERHLDALRRASESLSRARSASESSTLEVVAGEVGLALAALGEITGEDVATELLDAIFQRFCIGK